MNLKMFSTKCLSLLLIMLCISPVMAADKIKNCSSAEKTALESANEYVTDHLENFLATSAAFLPAKYKDKLKKKWPKTTLKCSNADKYCARKEFGAFVSVGNVLRYCTKEFDLTTAKLCDIVGITAHELGHVAGIPKHARHNHSNLYSSVRAGDSDLVYRLGNEMESYCDIHSAGSSPSVVQVSSGEIGATCKKNSDCNSKKCQGKGAVRECVCADDDDCGAARCKKRLGKNYCIAKGTGPGDFCKKNSDCDIGICQKKSCVCKTDSDCKSFYVGTNDIRCANRVGKNFCQETKQGLGESCHKNSDCSGNLKCKKKECSN